MVSESVRTLVSTPVNIGDLYVVDANSRATPRQITHVNEALFNTLTLSTPEEFWYKSFDGKDIQGWILKPPDNSNGDFQGYFQYAGSNFDGRIWGHLNFMGGLASVDMGNSANNAAIDVHFGPSGPWHIDAGKQQGPRIDGHLLVTDANMYVMLSDAGLSIGGGETISLNVGDDSVASAYVRGSVDMGLTITPQPHISGDFAASVSAGVCVDNVCVSAGVSAQVHAEALPLEMDASASIGLPWPLGSISFSVHL